MTDIRRTRPMFSDLLNLPRGKYVPPAIAEGGRIGFARGVFGTTFDRDLIPVPHAGVFDGIPDVELVLDGDRRTSWQPGTDIALGDLHADGAPFALCPRGALKRAIAAWQARGLSPMVGLELEAYVFEQDADGVWQPYDSPGAFVYGCGPMNDPAGLMDAIWETADTCGIPIESMNGEYDNGQFELTLGFGDGARRYPGHFARYGPRFVTNRRAALAVFRRELKRSVRRRQDVVQPLIFFVLVITVLALAIGPDAVIFDVIAPASVWIAVLLATTLNLDTLFLDDYRTGLIEQLALSAAALPALVAAKIAAHWVTTALPQILMALAVALVLGFDPRVLAALVATLLLGSPVLVLVGAVASALTVGLRGGAMLLALIILPLYLPTLIFGTSAIHNARLDLAFSAELYFLAGLAVLAASLAPFGAAAALKIRLS